MKKKFLIKILKVIGRLHFLSYIASLITNILYIYNGGTLKSSKIFIKNYLLTSTMFHKIYVSLSVGNSHN